jgi:hypothetical protein
MADLREVFEMATKTTEPDQDSWQDQERRQRRTARNRKVGALVVAAAIGLAAVVLILELRPGENATTPATEPSVVNPADTTALQVTTGFLEAFGAFDADRARTYLAEGADITGMTEGKGVEGLSLMTSWLEASGYQQTITSCEAGTSSPDTSVLCAFDFHGLRSDAIGRGPFTGSDFTITIRDGEIVRASMSWEIEKFSPQMWEPFADWVSTTYPKDAAVMYQDDTFSNFRLTQESIQLWDLHTREYVKEVNQGTAGQ